MRYLLAAGLLALVYFAGVGFIRTAEKIGWSESDSIHHK